jgi:hypothetical protein
MAGTTHVSTRRIHIAGLTMRRGGGRQKACSPPVSEARRQVSFAVLDLSENQIRIMKHLQRNWDPLSRTETPRSEKNRSAMWILADHPDAPRLVPVRSLAERTVVELEVPIKEIHKHVETQLSALISRHGIPDNFPRSRGHIAYQPSP